MPPLLDLLDLLDLDKPPRFREGGAKSAAPSGIFFCVQPLGLGYWVSNQAPAQGISRSLQRRVDLEARRGWQAGRPRAGGDLLSFGLVRAGTR
jgi:hypothetical protein